MAIYNLDRSYFSDIDTEEKAYWLGFLFADGYVAKDKNRVLLELSNVDKIHLEKFCKSLNYNGMVRSIKGNKSRVTCYSVEMAKDLIKQGCVNAKTMVLKPPEEVPNGLISHFCRGYQDGDGSIFYRIDQNRYVVSSLGTYEVLDFIISNSPINANIRKSENIWTFQFSAKDKVKDFLLWLYKDATICLDRKYEKAALATGGKDAGNL